MKYWRTPLDLERIRIPHGEVHILRERCKGCGFCVEYCPKQVLALSDEFNRKGYHYPVVVEADDCVHCDLCEMICPDFAIFCVADATDASDAARAPAQTGAAGPGGAA